MRSCSASVEQPCLCKYETAGLERRHPPTAHAGRAQKRYQAIRSRRLIRRAANYYGVEFPGIRETFGLDSRADGGLRTGPPSSERIVMS